MLVPGGAIASGKRGPKASVPAAFTPLATFEREEDVRLETRR
jgi:hypothetical protein